MKAKLVFGELVKSCPRCGATWYGEMVGVNFSHSRLRGDGFQLYCKGCQNTHKTPAVMVECQEMEWVNYPTRKNLHPEHLAVVENWLKKNRVVFISTRWGEIWRWGSRKKILLSDINGSYNWKWVN